ncbi:protein D1-like [Maniola jurtina]|uniref:protein D1-like n=1 Tax=Maniola jurtina TaxID=191418 RepID=UPI001E689581|nr:protein D1-like [Maniola jurtina]
MKLVLACTAVVLLLSAVELARPMRRRKNSIAQIYRAANITPVPEQILQVNFGGIKVTPGLEVAPEDAVDLPTIGFDFIPGCYYTFLAYNSNYSISFLSPSIVGLYVNLNGDMLADSSAIATWLGPSPSPGTGINRYILNVYKQSGLIDTTDEQLLSYQIDRLRFPIDDFVATYGLSGPVAGTFFLSQYPVFASEDCL